MRIGFAIIGISFFLPQLVFSFLKEGGIAKAESIEVLLDGYDFSAVIEIDRNEEVAKSTCKLIHIYKGEFRPGTLKPFRVEEMRAGRYLVAISEDRRSVGRIWRSPERRVYATLHDVTGEIYMIRLVILEQAII